MIFRQSEAASQTTRLLSRRAVCGPGDGCAVAGLGMVRPSPLRARRPPLVLIGGDGGLPQGVAAGLASEEGTPPLLGGAGGAWHRNVHTEMLERSGSP